MVQRIYRKADHTAEEKATLQAVREHFQTERPTLDELVASGEYTEPVRHGVTMEVMQIAALLKQARQEADLSLTEAARRCGLDRAAIRGLESGVYEHTTIHTLSRLAEAYGKRFVIQLVDAESI